MLIKTNQIIPKRPIKKTLCFGMLAFSILIGLFFTIGLAEAANKSNNKNSNKNSNANANNNNNSNGNNQNTNSNSNSNANANQNADNSNVNGQQQDQSVEDKMNDLSKIEDKIQNYNKMIEIKQGEQKTLANQIDIIDNQINATKEEVVGAEKKIELLNLEISSLGLQIDQQDELIKKKKSALKLLLNDLYRKETKNPLEILLSYSELSSFVQEVAYSEQANDRVFNKMQEINDLQKELTGKQNSEKNKRSDLENSRQDKVEKSQYLEGEQNSRENLLQETQGEESRYQDMLKRVEEEKQTLLGDIDELSMTKSSELGATQSHQTKPTSGLASADWYFSQKDPRWGNVGIGNSNTKMSSYGCAVTCVAMVLKYHGVNISPGIMAKQPIFSSDLIVWPEIWQNVKRVGSYAHGNINWDTVDSEIENHNPVIVFVRANGRGAGHYVVIHHKDNNGRYVVHDPMWGGNIFLTSTKENIGVLYGTSTSVDQMIIYENTKRTGTSVPETTSSSSADNNNSGANTTTNSNASNSNKNVNSNANKNKNANSN